MNDRDFKPSTAPKIVSRSDHNVSRADVSESALKVLYRLKNSGFAAFLVGGGVRDLLLNLHPKDFDIVTDAHPEQVKKLFRNSRLIGRRFRLAHVRFGQEIIEVATFRASSNGVDDSDRSHSDSGRILRDNVYGTIDEDIWRRDFTINSLYYNIADFSVWDYTSGMDDIRSRKLRLIGDPATRYREDPVRMLRAIRFATKLDFKLAAETAAPIAEVGHLLADVPAARLFEEVLKMFLTGHAVKSFEYLVRYDLLRYLFPAASVLLETGDAERVQRFIQAGLANTDQRIREDKSVTPMFLYAVLLWPAIKQLADKIQAESQASEYEAMNEACQRVMSEQQQRTPLPKRFGMPMKEILLLQRRFQNRVGVRAARILEHKRFRAGYDFLVLRSRCGEVDSELADWWTEVQQMSATEQRQAFDIKGRQGGKGRRRGKRPGRQDTRDAVS